MVHIPASGFILALYALKIQAIPFKKVLSTEYQEVSILDLARNGTVKESGNVNVTYEYSLPAPDRKDSFENNGITFYKYPAGGVNVNPGFWEERGISLPNATK